MVSTNKHREVCRMQQAETVLNVIRERGERGLPLENIYRLLYNRNLYLRAYGRIYSNQGATTEGITAETMDGMSLAKIDRIIEALRYERFRWTPVRRVNIPKPNGKTRALGIPTGPDKLLQEVIRMILEGLLRAAVFRPLPRLSAQPGVPHRLEQRDHPLDWCPLVRRGRHHLGAPNNGSQRRLRLRKVPPRSKPRRLLSPSTEPGYATACGTASRTA